MENKKKILVVDDDENIRLVLRDKLSISGFDVSEAKNGKEGLDRALADHPDAILLDVMMPEMDGWGMLKELRKDAWGKDAKIIMLTVVEDEESIAHALNEGSFTYLIKTDQNIDEIVEKIEDTVRE